MAEFKKFKSKTGNVGWYLLLTSLEDVIEYLDIDSTLIAQELVSITDQVKRFEHIPHASSTIGQITHTLWDLINISGRSPSSVLSDVSLKKVVSFGKIIERGDVVLINPLRGYSDLSGMMRIWEFEELQTLPANKPFAFPINDSIELPKVKHLILENNVVRDHQYWYKRFQLDPTTDDCGIIDQLKEQDIKQVFDALQYASHIYFETLGLDDCQNAAIIKLFERLDSKEIVIRTGAVFRDKLTQLPNYSALAAKHKIIFPSFR